MRLLVRYFRAWQNHRNHPVGDHGWFGLWHPHHDPEIEFVALWLFVIPSKLGFGCHLWRCWRGEHYMEKCSAKCFGTLSDLSSRVYLFTGFNVSFLAALP